VASAQSRNRSRARTFKKNLDRLLKAIDNSPSTTTTRTQHFLMIHMTPWLPWRGPGEESTVSGASALVRATPEFVAAARAIFGYPYDIQPEHAKWLIYKKKACGSDGRHRVLTAPRQINRDLPGHSRWPCGVLDPKRFLGLFFVILPLCVDNHNLIAKNGDMAMYTRCRKKCSALLKQEVINGLPADLSGLEAFVRHTLADNHTKAVCHEIRGRFISALSPFAIRPEKAEAIYAQFHAGGVPSE